MINLGINNNKLFFRAIGLISELAVVDVETARRSLVCAIHGADFEESADTSIRHHIEVATPQKQVRYDLAVVVWRAFAHASLH